MKYIFFCIGNSIAFDFKDAGQFWTFISTIFSFLATIGTIATAAISYKYFRATKGILSENTKMREASEISIKNILEENLLARSLTEHSNEISQNAAMFNVYYSFNLLLRDTKVNGVILFFLEQRFYTLDHYNLALISKRQHDENYKGVIVDQEPGFKGGLIDEMFVCDKILKIFDDIGIMEAEGLIDFRFIKSGWSHYILGLGSNEYIRTVLLKDINFFRQFRRLYDRLAFEYSTEDRVRLKYAETFKD